MRKKKRTGKREHDEDNSFFSDTFVQLTALAAGVFPINCYLVGEK